MKGPEGPVRYPTLALERLLHLARDLHDGQTRAVLSLSGRVDAGRIARAFQLSLDAEPILGCRFVEHPWRPYWERLPGEKLVSPLSVVETQDQDAIHDWLGTPLDASREAQVHACLFRGAADKLAVKLSHEAADAVGKRDYLAVVGAIYRRLRTNPHYVPVPGVEKRIGQGPVLRNARFRDLVRGCLHFSTPAPGLDFPNDGTGVPAFASRRLGPRSMARIRQYCRDAGVTVHEVLLAAFYRLQFQKFASSPGAVLTIPIPIDLRRYLPHGSTWGVCNLSAIFFAGVQNQAFDTLVRDVRRVMSWVRSRKPWLGQALLAELVFLPPYGLIARLAKRSNRRRIASGRIYPYISNNGIVDPRPMDFEGATVRHLETWGPVLHHSLPNFSVYTMGDTLMATVTTRDEPNGRKADRFLDAYLSQLPGQGCPATLQTGVQSEN